MANIFPKWSNDLPRLVIIALLLLGVFASSVIAYYMTPKYTRVGYAPKQPVSYSHYLHVEQLGLDCRYCHTNVDKSGHANVPASSTCMGCHNAIKAESPLLAPIRASYQNGQPVNWIRIHQTPDYVYFNHAAHVNRGVSCVHCHGNVDDMEVVYHAEPLSMGFCLDCHKQPEKYLRPLEHVYDLDWTADGSHPEKHPEETKEKKFTVSPAQLELGRKLKAEWNINPPISCSGCHR